MLNSKLSIAAPTRPRSQATKGLDSDLPLKLAEEMLKYTVMPKALARNHWKIEITSHLNQLFFKVSDSSEMTEDGRRIKSVHYSITKVRSRINDLTADATEALKPYIKNEKFKYPNNFAEGNLFEYGWELKEKKKGKYLVWILLYQDKVICEVYGD